MEELSRMRQLSLVTTNILGWEKSSANLPRHPEFESPMGYVIYVKRTNLMNPAVVRVHSRYSIILLY